MSVTFGIAQFEEIEGLGTVLVQGSRCDHSRPASCCSDAEIYFGQCEHAEADEDACGCRRYNVNLSNANAAQVLERLGYDFDPECPCGEDTPEGLLGRAQVANVGRDDSGSATVEDGGPGTGRALWIDCGVAAGYYDRTMARLAELATAAQAQDKMVSWA